MSEPISFTDEEVQELLSNTSISSEHPWRTNDETKIDLFYKDICEEIASSTRTSSKIEWNHYGSGYASFIDAWFYRPSPEFAVENVARKGEAYAGLVVLLSRLSPHFCLMEGQKSWHGRGGTSYMPGLELVDSFTRPAIDSLAKQVGVLLEPHGLHRLKRSDLSSALRSDAIVPTILSNEPYTVFDAMFHWED